MWLNAIFAAAEAHSAGLTAILTGVLAVLTLLYMIANFWLVIENRELRKMGSAPQVVAYLKPDDRSIMVINFVLSNVGRGPAFDVMLELDKGPSELSTHGIRVRVPEGSPPIAVLPQDESISTFFGTGPELLRAPLPVTATIRFRDSRRRQHSIESVLDIAQIQWLVRTGETAEDVAAKALEKIVDRMDDWSSGFRRLHVDAATRQEVPESSGDEG